MIATLRILDIAGHRVNGLDRRVPRADRAPLDVEAIAAWQAVQVRTRRAYDVARVAADRP